MRKDNRMSLKEMRSIVMSAMGKKGGKARAESLSPKRRSEISADAGRASGAARLGVERGPYKKTRKAQRLAEARREQRASK